MDATRYCIKSVLHHRFAYLGVLAGAVVGAVALLGALFAGDSVEASLRRIGASRIGQTTHVLAAGDRFFREVLAEDFDRNAGTRSAPVVYARGTAAVPSSRVAVNQVQLVGVTDAFWKFAPDTTAPIPLNAAASTVAVNDTLARRLAIKTGDTIIVRLQKPGILAGNAPVAGSESTLQSIRGTVSAVVDDASFGRFSLEATQIPQPTVFLPIQLLQEILGTPARANLLLIDARGKDENLAPHLARAVKLGDYGLALKWIEKASAFEITSDRIFIDPEINEALTSAIPAAQPVVSYLVNEFRVRDRTTPYSIATAASPEATPFLSSTLGPRDVALNDWLASDLKAAIGDDVRLTYFQAGDAGVLVERNATFRVREIVPLEGLAADRAWMPDFPGMTDAATTSDWDPGLPLNLNLIRKQDEQYWDDHRGTPKAFLSIAGGREIWSTRWGNTTALRIPFDRGRYADLTATILDALRPEMNQLLLSNIRMSAQDAATSSVDFAGLFIGMSFFLILSALGLVAMLFQFCLLQRNHEDALLGALGVPPRKLLRWRLGEALLILVVGCSVGLPLAVLYTRVILEFLESIWAGLGGGSTFVFAAKPESIVAGGVAFLAFSLVAIWLAIRKLARQALSIRLAARTEDTASPAGVRRSSIAVALTALAGAAASITFSGRGIPAQVAFYLAGLSLLVLGLAIGRWWMARSRPERPGELLDAGELGVRTLKARRSRSLTVIGLIATAVFMVLSVASFRKQVGDDWLERDSGTGGFAFWMETTLPQNVARDGTSKGFELFEALSRELGEIVPLRAGAGDNVNCFNLNSTSQPQLLAVDTAKLATRNAFHLKMPGKGAESGWKLLQALRSGGAIPALVDETTLMWALKRKVGDVLTYNDENGQSFDVQIAGTIPDSVFQGYLLVDEQLFLKRFPSNAGYTVFLADAAQSGDHAKLEDLRNRLETALRDAGGKVTLARDVLAAFHQIENTYIAIFNVLGSFGVVLGSLGLAIVVARNLRERRGEFAVMQAMGIPHNVLARMVSAEFGRLVLWGIGIGGVASATAVGPTLSTLPAAPTLVLVAGLICGIAALNFASGFLIFRYALRGLRPDVELSNA